MVNALASVDGVNQRRARLVLSGSPYLGSTPVRDIYLGI